MTINQLTTRIQIQHNQDLAAFRQDITSPPYQAGTPTTLNNARRSVRMNPVHSVEDASASLTIVADVQGLAWLTADKGLQGSCITLSIAGHRRNTGTRVPLPLAECDAWVEAILGRSWLAHVYRAGAPDQADGKLDIASYRLFLDERSNPVAKPKSVVDDTLRRMDLS
jgi:hypothetical protein